MDLNDYTKEQLWQLLVDTVHTIPMYSPHKAYIRDTILPKQPDVSPNELSGRLNMSLGEAIITLDELKKTEK